jgi:hypothetical protein
MPRRIIQSNLSFSHAPVAPNEIIDNNTRSRHNQRAITSEGGHTNDESARTSEGAKALTKSFSLMEYMARKKDPRLQPLWKRGFGNEVRRLFQGIHNIPGTDTCFFIKHTNIPKNRWITYGKMVCDYKPHKKKKSESG